MIKKIFSNRLVSNFSWIVIANIFQMIVSLVVGMFSARYLGPSNYGIINYVASFVAFFTPIATLGMEGVLIREFTSRKKTEGTVIGTALIMGLVASAFSSVSIICLVGVLKHWDSLLVVIAFLQSLTLLFKAFNVIDYWYQSQLLSKYPAIIKCIGYFSMSLYKVVLIVTGKSVVWFSFALGVDTLLIAVLLFILYKKSNGARLIFDIGECKSILTQSLPFIVSGMVGVVYTQMDKIMIEQLLDDSMQTGLYSAAMNVCTIWAFVPQAIITSGRPKVMELKQQNNPTYLLRLKQLYSIVIWTCIAFSAGITIFNRLIIFILYGKDYMDATNTLVILIWYSVFAMIGTARSIWVICENKNKYVWRYLIFGSITNIVLNTALIPVMGINGAAIATLASQIMSAIIAPTFYKETRIHSYYVLEAFILKDTIPMLMNRRKTK